MFNSLATQDANRGYGKREYRFMLYPDMEGQVSEKSAISACESGAMIIPKDSNKDRLKVTKEFLAYMASDDALKIFLQTTGCLMPYELNLTDSEKEKLTPFCKNMIELYYDTENIEVVRPNVAQLYSPLAYTSERPTNVYFIPEINGIMVSEPLKAVREYSLSSIKTGLFNLYDSNDANYIAQARRSFYQD